MLANFVLTKLLEYDGDNEGRVQTDNEYKLTIPLIYLVRTIKMFHIRNHMHHAGLHEFPIPTYPLEPSNASRKHWTSLKLAPPQFHNSGSINDDNK